MQLLMWVPFVFALSVLVYAAVLDFRKREVSNRLWCFAYPIGCAMTLGGLGFGLFDVGAVLVSVLVCVFLGVGLVWSGFYGGADIKALLFIALSAPTIPLALSPALNVPSLPLVLTVFCNSTLLSLIWPLSIFSLNLKDTLKGNRLFEDLPLALPQKIRLFFTTRRTTIEKMEGLRYFPSEQIEVQNGQPTRKFLRVMKAETDLTKCYNELNTYKHLYKEGVLASPTIPTILFFAVAFGVAPLGNLFFWAVTLLVM
ncbi:MAG: prepilin peptidase [Nitrososphaerota archaeon]|jgi:Flp pilus assembly protein protease CpaA|nr:prepilin peptidase [Nitrososphaerota archaeon]